MNELAILSRVIASGELLRYRAGPNGFTTRFEKELCSKMRIKHALAVNSGTNALLCALVGTGIGPGDEVLIPAYTWVSTAIAPLAVGALPVLVDIDETLTIDPDDIERKITPYTKAIIPVHMLNLVCNMNAITAIAKKHGLKIIEDACQAVGVKYKGRRVGTMGDAGAFSFNQYKNLNSGEGGAVLTDDDRTFIRAFYYADPGSYTREHGFVVNEPTFAGMNFRVSELTGAVMYAQLHRLDRYLERMRRHRAAYAETLSTSRFFRISPHNDLESALGLTVVFDDPEDARKFAKNRGVEHLIDTGRHVYTNWEPIMSQRTFDERMNPYRHAKRVIEYTPDMCRITLDILSRTCRIAVGAQYPLALTRVRAKMLLNAPPSN